MLYRKLLAYTFKANCCKQLLNCKFHFTAAIVNPRLFSKITNKL